MMGAYSGGEAQLEEKGQIEMVRIQYAFIQQRHTKRIKGVY